jgi:hypothetical protein
MVEALVVVGEARQVREHQVAVAGLAGGAAVRTREVAVLLNQLHPEGAAEVAARGPLEVRLVGIGHVACSP